jgi:hypothetical protein
MSSKLASAPVSLPLCVSSTLLPCAVVCSGPQIRISLIETVAASLFRCQSHSTVAHCFLYVRNVADEAKFNWKAPERYVHTHWHISAVKLSIFGFKNCMVSGGTLQPTDGYVGARVPTCRSSCAQTIAHVGELKALWRPNFELTSSSTSAVPNRCAGLAEEAYRTAI